MEDNAECAFVILRVEVVGMQVERYLERQLQWTGILPCFPLLSCLLLQAGRTCNTFWNSLTVASARSNSLAARFSAFGQGTCDILLFGQGSCSAAFRVNTEVLWIKHRVHLWIS